MPEDVAEILQVDKSWVYAAARRDAIPHVKVGRYIRFERTALADWIAGQRVGPSMS